MPASLRKDKNNPRILQKNKRVPPKTYSRTTASSLTGTGHWTLISEMSTSLWIMA